jgi:hypothetical protein
MQKVFVIDTSSKVTQVRLQNCADAAELAPGHHHYPVECMCLLHDDILQPGMDRASRDAFVCRVIAIGYDQEVARQNPKDPFPKLVQIRFGETLDRTFDMMLNVRKGLIIDGVLVTPEKIMRSFERLLTAGRLAAENNKTAVAA